MQFEMEEKMERTSKQRFQLERIAKDFLLKDDLFIVYRLHRCSRKMCFWTPLSKFSHHYPQTVHQL